MKKTLTALVCTFLLATLSPAFAQKMRYKPRPNVDQWHLKHYPFDNPNLPTKERINNLLSLMTLQEKIDCFGTDTGVPRLGVPNIGASEGIHGVVQRQGRPGMPPITTTQFPQPPGMGATWDPKLVEEAAGVEGYEARWITQTPKYNRQILELWGPQADLDRDPRWGRSEEVYGEDPFLNGTMAVAFTHGLQGNNPKYWQAASLLKHFLANENEDLRTTSSSNFSHRLFWEYYSVPFRMDFTEGGARGVMASYNAWNGVPMAINPALRKDVIGKWGVDIVSSDGGAITLLVKARHLFPTQEDAVVASFHAGVNQFLDFYLKPMEQAVKDGRITEAQIDNALRRKFEVEFKLGLLDPPSMVPYTKIRQTGNEPAPWNTERDRSVSQKIAQESVVLLKNKDNFLPLDKSKIKTIAVIGPLANVVHWDWYGGTPPYTVTPLQGIQKEAGPGVKVIYAPDENSSEEGAALKAASKADVAVVVVGNDPTCGPDMGMEWRPTPHGGGTLPCTVRSDGREGRDRQTMTLYQEQLIKQIYYVNKKTVVMLISSFPFTINWTEANVPAIMTMAQSSQDEGTALANVLFGKYDPSGHLVRTWPKSMKQLPPRMDYNIRDGYTYMYFRHKPLYPFGFGLSYTTFKMSNLKPSTTTLAKNGTMNVSVDVTNTGKMAGAEVVQLYTAWPHPLVVRPKKELEGFQRVMLQPGQTKTVTIPLKASQLAFWNVGTHSFDVLKEPIKLMVGDSSAHIEQSATIQLQ